MHGIDSNTDSRSNEKKNELCDLASALFANSNNNNTCCFVLDGTCETVKKTVNEWTVRGEKKRVRFDVLVNVPLDKKNEETMGDKCCNKCYNRLQKKNDGLLPADADCGEEILFAMKRESRKEDDDEFYESVVVVENPKPRVKCELCEKTFTRASTMREHMRVHSGEKPLKCDICQKKFSYAGVLRFLHDCIVFEFILISSIYP